MSLLPRIPCRKLFVDSRFALPGGTATEFTVEVPQGLEAICGTNTFRFVTLIP